MGTTDATIAESVDIDLGEYQRLDESDRDALERALAEIASVGAGTLYLPPGRYIIRQPLVVAGAYVTIAGDPGTIVHLHLANADKVDTRTHVFTLIGEIHRACFRGLTIIGPGAPEEETGGARGACIGSADGALVHSLVVEDCVLSDRIVGVRVRFAQSVRGPFRFRRNRIRRVVRGVEVSTDGGPTWSGATARDVRFERNHVLVERGTAAESRGLTTVATLDVRLWANNLSGAGMAFEQASPWFDRLKPASATRVHPAPPHHLWRDTMTVGRIGGSLPPFLERIPSGWIDVAALIQPDDPDATRAVDRALKALGRRRGTLYFHPGTYVVNSPEIPIERAYTCILGAQGATIVQHASRLARPLFVVGPDAHGVHFEGITLIGAGSASAGDVAHAAIRCEGADLTVADCNISGVTTGVYLVGGPNELGLVDIRDTYIHGVVNGIYAVGGEPFAMPFERHIGFEVFGCRIECSSGLPDESTCIRTQGLGDIRVVGCNLVGGGLAANFLDVPEPLDTAVLFAENTCSAGVSGARLVVQNRFSPLTMPRTLVDRDRRPFVDDAGYVTLIRTPDHGLCLIQANTVDRYTATLTGGAPVRGIYIRPGAGAELVSNQLFSLAGSSDGKGAGIYIDGVTDDVTPHAVSAVANQFDDLQVGVRVEAPPEGVLRPALLIADSRFTNINKEAVRAANVDDVVVSNCVADGVWREEGDLKDPTVVQSRGALLFEGCTRVRVASSIATNRGLPAVQGMSFAVRGRDCGVVAISGCTVVEPRIPASPSFDDFRRGRTYLEWLPPTSDGGPADPDSPTTALRPPRVFAPRAGGGTTAELLFETNNIVGTAAQLLPLYQAGANVD
jgi:hypothetical protein